MAAQLSWRTVVMAGLAGIVIAAGAGAAGYLIGDSDSPALASPERRTDFGNRVLNIGLDPKTIDFSRYPGLDEAILRSRVAAGQAAIRAAGFDATYCVIAADPNAAEKQVRECLSGGPFGQVMIGAGLRTGVDHTVLFERVVEVVNTVEPGVRFAFNATPLDAVDALRRTAHS
jgi:hypothetical protein